MSIRESQTPQYQSSVTSPSSSYYNEWHEDPDTLLHQSLLLLMKMRSRMQHYARCLRSDSASPLTADNPINSQLWFSFLNSLLVVVASGSTRCQRLAIRLLRHVLPVLDPDQLDATTAKISALTLYPCTPSLTSDAQSTHHASSIITSLLSLIASHLLGWQTEVRDLLAPSPTNRSSSASDSDVAPSSMSPPTESKRFELRLHRAPVSRMSDSMATGASPFSYLRGDPTTPSSSTEIPPYPSPRALAQRFIDQCGSDVLEARRAQIKADAARHARGVGVGMDDDGENDEKDSSSDGPSSFSPRIDSHYMSDLRTSLEQRGYGVTFTGMRDHCLTLARKAAAAGMVVSIAPCGPDEAARRNYANITQYGGSWHPFTNAGRQALSCAAETVRTLRHIVNGQNEKWSKFVQTTMLQHLNDITTHVDRAAGNAASSASSASTQPTLSSSLLAAFGALSVISGVGDDAPIVGAPITLSLREGSGAACQHEDTNTQVTSETKSMHDVLALGAESSQLLCSLRTAKVLSMDDGSSQLHLITDGDEQAAATRVHLCRFHSRAPTHHTEYGWTKGLDTDIARQLMQGILHSVMKLAHEEPSSERSMLASPSPSPYTRFLSSLIHARLVRALCVLAHRRECAALILSDDDHISTVNYLLDVCRRNGAGDYRTTVGDWMKGVERAMSVAAECREAKRRGKQSILPDVVPLRPSPPSCWDVDLASHCVLSDECRSLLYVGGHGGDEPPLSGVPHIVSAVRGKTHLLPATIVANKPFVPSVAAATGVGDVCYFEISIEALPHGELTIGLCPSHSAIHHRRLQGWSAGSVLMSSTGQCGMFVDRARSIPGEQLQTGDLIDARDSVGRWEAAAVANIHVDDEGNSTVKLHFVDWDCKYDEEIVLPVDESSQADIDSRIATFGTFTRNYKPGQIFWRQPVKDSSWTGVAQDASVPSLLYSFGVGDTVGCGWIPAENRIFFTLNGSMLPFDLSPIESESATDAAPTHTHAPTQLYPAVTVCHRGAQITANFGQHKPFMYDPGQAVRPTTAIPSSSASSSASEQASIHELPVVDPHTPSPSSACHSEYDRLALGTVLQKVCGLPSLSASDYVRLLRECDDDVEPAVARAYDEVSIAHMRDRAQTNVKAEESPDHTEDMTESGETKQADDEHQQSNFDNTTTVFHWEDDDRTDGESAQSEDSDDDSEGDEYDDMLGGPFSSFPLAPRRRLSARRRDSIFGSLVGSSARGSNSSSSSSSSSSQRQLSALPHSFSPTSLSGPRTSNDFLVAERHELNTNMESSMTAMMPLIMQPMDDTMPANMTQNNDASAAPRARAQARSNGTQPTTTPSTSASGAAAQSTGSTRNTTPVSADSNRASGGSGSGSGSSMSGGASRSPLFFPRDALTDLLRHLRTGDSSSLAQVLLLLTGMSDEMGANSPIQLAWVGGDGPEGSNIQATSLLDTTHSFPAPLRPNQSHPSEPRVRFADLTLGQRVRISHSARGLYARHVGVDEDMNIPAWLAEMDGSVGECGVVKQIDRAHALALIEFIDVESSRRRCLWFPVRALTRLSSVRSNAYVGVVHPAVFAPYLTMLQRRSIIHHARQTMLVLLQQVAARRAQIALGNGDGMAVVRPSTPTTLASIPTALTLGPSSIRFPLLSYSRELVLSASLRALDSLLNDQPLTNTLLPPAHTQMLIDNHTHHARKRETDTRQLLHYLCLHQPQIAVESLQHTRRMLRNHSTHLEYDMKDLHLLCNKATSTPDTQADVNASSVLAVSSPNASPPTSIVLWFHRVSVPGACCISFSFQGPLCLPSGVSLQFFSNPQCTRLTYSFSGPKGRHCQPSPMPSPFVMGGSTVWIRCTLHPDDLIMPVKGSSSRTNEFDQKVFFKARVAPLSEDYAIACSMMAHMVDLYQQHNQVQDSERGSTEHRHESLTDAIPSSTAPPIDDSLLRQLYSSCVDILTLASSGSSSSSSSSGFVPLFTRVQLSQLVSQLLLSARPGLLSDADLAALSPLRTQLNALYKADKAQSKKEEEAVSLRERRKKVTLVMHSNVFQATVETLIAANTYTERCRSRPTAATSGEGEGQGQHTDIHAGALPSDTSLNPSSTMYHSDSHEAEGRVVSFAASDSDSSSPATSFCLPDYLHDLRLVAVHLRAMHSQPMSLRANRDTTLVHAAGDVHGPPAAVWDLPARHSCYERYTVGGLEPGGDMKSSIDSSTTRPAPRPLTPPPPPPIPGAATHVQERRSMWRPSWMQRIRNMQRQTEEPEAQQQQQTEQQTDEGASQAGVDPVNAPCAVSSSLVWPFSAYVQLCRLLRSIATDSRLPPHEVPVSRLPTLDSDIFTASPHVAYAELAQACDGSYEELQRQASMLQRLNALVLHTLTQVDMSICGGFSESWELQQFTSIQLSHLHPGWPHRASIMQLLERSHEILFTEIKTSFLDCIMAISARGGIQHGQTIMPALRINRLKASAAAEEAHKPTAVSSSSSNATPPFPDYFSHISSTMLGQAYGQLRGLSLACPPPPTGSSPHTAFEVRLEGESVLGLAGPYRIFFDGICAELQAQHMHMKRGLVPLFTPTPNHAHELGEYRRCFMPHPSAVDVQHIELFEFIGRLLGVAMRTKVLLAFDLPPLFWTLLVGRQATLAHLMHVDHTTAMLIQRLRACHDQRAFNEEFGIESFDHDEVGSTSSTTSALNFSVTRSDHTLPHCVGANHSSISSTPVTFSTRLAYADALEHIRLYESYEAVSAIRRGLSEQIPLHVLSLFSAQELELACCGGREIDIDALQAHTDYSSPMSADSIQVKWLFDILKNKFTNEQRKKFVKFVSASERLPSSEHDWNHPRTRFLLKNAYGSTDRPDDILPHAETCFLALQIPQYSSYEIMHDRLLTAISTADAMMDGDVHHEDIPTRNARSRTAHATATNTPSRRPASIIHRSAVTSPALTPNMSSSSSGAATSSQPSNQSTSTSAPVPPVTLPPPLPSQLSAQPSTAARNLRDQPNRMSLHIGASGEDELEAQRSQQSSSVDAALQHIRSIPPGSDVPLLPRTSRHLPVPSLTSSSSSMLSLPSSPHSSDHAQDVSSRSTSSSSSSSSSSDHMHMWRQLQSSLRSLPLVDLNDPTVPGSNLSHQEETEEEDRLD